MKLFKNLKGKKREALTLVCQIFLIFCGTFVMSFGYCVFLAPYNIVPGGFLGLAKIIHDVLAKIGFTFISTSVWYIILNAFLYIYAFVLLGWKFGLRSGIGIFSYSFFVSLISKFDVVSYIGHQFEIESATLGGGSLYILFAIFGGLLMGVGMGIVFRANGSTGGCDMLAVVTNRFFPTITTGQLVIAVDGLVVVLSSLAYSSLVLPLYALITIFICGKVSDLFVDGVRSLRAYYILTNKKEEIAQKIMTDVERGVTNIKCEGMYTHGEKDMLLVILRRSQVMQVKKIIKEIDSDAFTFSHNVKEAYGNGFLAYKPPQMEISKLIKSKKKRVKKSKFAQTQRGNDNLENQNQSNMDKQVVSGSEDKIVEQGDKNVDEKN
ncbi:MAG: YitT family protein [Christensenellales bacterium]